MTQDGPHVNLTEGEAIVESLTRLYNVRMSGAAARALAKFIDIEMQRMLRLAMEIMREEIKHELDEQTNKRGGSDVT